MEANASLPAVPPFALDRSVISSEPRQAFAVIFKVLSPTIASLFVLVLDVFRDELTDPIGV
jgi:hypothetical protein